MLKERRQAEEGSGQSEEADRMRGDMQRAMRGHQQQPKLPKLSFPKLPSGLGGLR